jgi:outer membrane receptor protein involved in Fe transport
MEEVLTSPLDNLSPRPSPLLSIGRGLAMALWLLCLCPSGVAGLPPLQILQGAPAITGTVLDSDGSAIAGAQLLLRDATGRKLAKSTSDGQGRFTLPIDPGQEAGLVLEVQASGFTAQRRPVDRAALPQPLEIRLPPGTVAEIVTVTPTRSEVRVVDAPASVSVLTSRELNAAAAQTFDDLLRQVPGFSIFRRSSSLVANPTTQGVSLRGVGATGASRTLVLADGVPLNDAFGGWVYWSRLPRRAVEQIEVVRGGSSDLYGSDALSGVIQVLSRSLPRPTIDLELTTGTRGTHDLTLFGGHRWNNFTASLAAEGLTTDGYFLLAPELRGAADQEARSRHRLLAPRFTWQPRDAASLFLRGSLFDENRHNGTRLQQNRTATESLAVGGRLDTPDGSRWTLTLFANQQRFHQGFTAVAANRASETLTRQQAVPSRDAGISLHWSQSRLGNHALVAGADLRGVRGTSDELVYAAGRPIRFDSAGGRQRRAGFFVQDLVALSRRWQLAASLRYDTWRDSSAGIVQRTLATGAIQPRFFAPRTENAWNPRISLLFRPSEPLSLRASAYRAFRAPTLNELYREFRVGDALTRANEALTSERLTGGEAGATWSLTGRTLVRLTGFWTETANPVVNVTESITPSLITRQRRNLGRTRSRGLEAEAELRLTSTLRLTAGYLLADATVLDAPQDPLLTGRQIPQVPRHQFTWQLAYANPRLLSAALQFRASGQQFDDDRNLLPLPRFALLDLSASRPLRRGLDLFLAVQNLFDVRYAVARTPLETLGMPRLSRFGLRLHWD